MAEASKKEAAPESSSTSDLVIFIVKVLAVFLAILLGLVLMFQNPETVTSFVYFLKWLQALGLLIIIGATVFALMMMNKFTPLNIALGDGYGSKYKAPTDNNLQKNKYTDRLAKVDMHVNSESEAEWKLSIIELDGILRDVLRDNGYEAETVADQLKQAEVRAFNNIQNAWDAHKIRNKIAHEGVSFTIDKREARRVYSLYKTVFEEFKIT